jgi:hypothetical protein
MFVFFVRHFAKILAICRNPRHCWHLKLVRPLRTGLAAAPGYRTSPDCGSRNTSIFRPFGAVHGTKILPVSASIRREMARARLNAYRQREGNVMKTMVLSAVLIAVATVANAQSRDNSMGGWGSGAQPSSIGSDRSSTWQAPRQRDFGGYQTTPGSALTGSSSTAPRQPLRR